MGRGEIVAWRAAWAVSVEIWGTRPAIFEESKNISANLGQL